MARWFYLLCVGLSAAISVIDANGCDCTRNIIREHVCSVQGQCTQGNVRAARELCFVRCRKKRVDPTLQQTTRELSPTGEDIQQWEDVSELKSDDVSCLLDNIYHKLSPEWRQRVVKLLTEAMSDMHN